MCKAQRILISLLLMAGVASSCSKPAESRKDKLMAQKERLITEIIDLVGPPIRETTMEEQGITGGAPSPEANVKVVKLALLGLCSAVERKEIADTDVKDFLVDHLLLDSDGNENEKKNMRDLLSCLINGTDGWKTTLKATIRANQGKKLYASMGEPKFDLICNKIQDLTKVVKEIRELN